MMTRRQKAETAFEADRISKRAELIRAGYTPLAASVGAMEFARDESFNRGALEESRGGFRVLPVAR